ncbi:MAG: acyltransferase family protein [Prevotella sp.]|nr:acyltransferase family protein [Prevotella sp.]
METGRLPWIDLLRGFCMLAILLDHTELYYADTNIINYHLYVTDALMTFFFISGYLFWKPNRAFSVRRKLASIARTIVVPYFIFTAVIALPKAFVHGTDFHLASTAVHILTGRASWFVAALITAELLFSIVLHFSRGKHCILAAFSVFSFLLSVVLSTRFPLDFWQIDNALLAVPMLYAGYLYHQKESFINRFNTKSFTLLLFLLSIIIKVYIQRQSVSLLIEPVSISNYAVFIADCAVSVLLLTNICKQLPAIKPIEWTGRRSLVYYFFCGGVPLTVSKALNKISFGYEGHYYRVVIAFIAVYIITSLIAWFVYRYVPKITGQRRNR